MTLNVASLFEAAPRRSPNAAPWSATPGGSTSGSSTPGRTLWRTTCARPVSGRTQIAGYKVPASIVVVDVVERSPSGKADYRWAESVLSTNTGLSTHTRRNDG
ncbi:hypothetical protein [Microbispora sp. H10830]|uniref:hypothetical protein n=1 Tax=Microbispora sp. H10830 TaxID=2729109 RepID=UPI0016026DBF|nr:hypothetical protein [Microbispora sp. H10830]